MEYDGLNGSLVGWLVGSKVERSRERSRVVLSSIVYLLTCTCVFVDCVCGFYVCVSI